MATAIYTRISQDSTGEAAGVQRQETACRSLAEQKGWDVARVYVDNDVSAYSGRRRPAYEDLVDDIKAGTIDRLIVWNPDRLHRRPVELEAFIPLVTANNVEIATVTSGEYDLSTQDGLLKARVVGAVAAAEMGKKSDRHKAKADELAAQGKAYGGPRTYGWTAGMGEIVPDEADVLREAARRVIEGESVNAIAVDLTERGVPSPGGGVWRRQTLRRALIHPRLVAKRVHKGAMVGDAVWDPILDRDTFARVTAVLTDPSRSKPRKGLKYPLTGLIEDWRGHPLTGRPKGDGRAYRTSYLEPGEPGCQVAAERVEAEVVERLLIRSDAAGLPVPETPDIDMDEVDRLRVELEEIAEMKASGEITVAEWKVARAGTAERLQHAEKGLSAARGVPEWVNRLAEPGALRRQWDDLTDQQKRAILETAIEKIVIGPGERGRRANVEGRVTVVWRG